MQKMTECILYLFSLNFARKIVLECIHIYSNVAFCVCISLRKNGRKKVHLLTDRQIRIKLQSKLHACFGICTHAHALPYIGHTWNKLSFYYCYNIFLLLFFNRSKVFFFFHYCTRLTHSLGPFLAAVLLTDSPRLSAPRERAWIFFIQGVNLLLLK